MEAVADDALLAAALRLADGEAIDDPSPKPDVSEQERRWLDRLRQLEALALIHTSSDRADSDVHDSIRSRAPMADGAPVRWGPLEIREKIGRGSYGDVYRARDTRLGRDVALKLLRHREQRSGEPSHLVEEGHLLSRVHHPNVVTVYGAERIDGRTGLWMELVDGETLEEELQRRGPLPPAEVVQLGIELASALHAVHQAGLLHRDVKTQNIKRTSKGRVVLMDFGGGGDALDASPESLTGTPAYMAPETLAGHPPNVSADVYALGVVLFRLATGRLPVEGRTLHDVREAHRLAQARTVRSVRPGVPRALAGVIDRALHVDPAVRFADARAVEAALVHIRSRRQRHVRMWSAATFVIVAVTVAVVWNSRLTDRFLDRNAAAGGVATHQPTMKQLTFNSVENPVTASAISPDGKYLAYVDPAGLVLQTLATGQQRRLSLPSPASPNDIAWMPDARSFLVSNPLGIWRTSIVGGDATRIADEGGAISVAPDGSRIAVRAPAGTHVRAIAVNGEPVGELVRVDAPSRVSKAVWAPDGRRIAYTVWSQTPRGVRIALETRRADGTDATTVHVDSRIHDVIWPEDGRVLFALSNPVPMARYTNLWQVRVNRDGRALDGPAQITNVPDFTFNRPTLTADGRQLAFIVTRQKIEVYVAAFDAAHRELREVRRAVFSNADSWPSAWTPDGRAILFSTQREPTLGIYRQPLDSADAQKVLTSTDVSAEHAVISPDRRWIYYLTEPRRSVMRVPAAGGAAEPMPQFTTAGVSTWLKCARAPANRCALTNVSPDRMRVTIFDGGNPAVKQELDFPAPTVADGWDLSPDGTRIAILVSRPARRLIVVDVRTRRVVRQFDSVPAAQWVAWISDADGWLLTAPVGVTGAEVIHLDARGNVKTMWKSPYQRLWRPVVSPDGRYVAFSSRMTESGAWLLRGF
jgi:eukaryotic-like serine/threonine-protein kinase